MASSPFSIILRNVRLRASLTQLQLARSLGYEQGYLSALELGIKTPRDEFLAKLVSNLNLDGKSLAELELAVKRSRRRYTLPPEVSTETYVFCSDLWDKIDRLHPNLLQALQQMISMDSMVLDQPQIQPTRFRRARKAEAAM